MAERCEICGKPLDNGDFHGDPGPDSWQFFCAPAQLATFPADLREKLRT